MFPPDLFVYTPGGNATFNCLVTGSGVGDVSVQWLVNETLLEHLNLTNVEIEQEAVPIFLSRLNFVDLSVYYNTSIVTCVATTSEPMEMANATSSLLAQGIYSYNNVLYLISSDTQLAIILAVHCGVLSACVV